MDVVSKVTKTGYVFWDINDDLGKAADSIMASTPHVKMAYAYARRCSVAALYIQAIVDADTYSHVTAIFKALQKQTGTSIEFQEQAARHSEEFMQTYSNQISSLFAKKVVEISQVYSLTRERISDADFFAEVVDTMYVEQEASTLGKQGS